MFSRHKLIASLIAVPALVAGALVATAASPAQAVTNPGVRLLSGSVAIGGYNSSHNRTGKVKLGCTFKTTTCKGTLRLLPESGTTGAPYFSYKVLPGKTAYATVYYWHDQTEITTFPTRLKRQIRFRQTGPGDNYNKSLWVEPKVLVRLEGKVTGPFLNDSSRIQDVQITMSDRIGLVTHDLRTVAVDPSDGSFYLGRYALGLNNASTKSYRLRIRAQVKDTTTNVWKFSQWYWRGNTSGNGNAYGGTKYVEDANGVRMTKYNWAGFDANFSFGAITGHVTGNGTNNVGAAVRISAPPKTMPKGSDLRSLDIPYCANDFATTKTNGDGNYDQTFLPASTVADKRYLVKVSGSGGMRLWNNAYGSCLHARNYVSSNTNLLAVPANGTVPMNAALRNSQAVLKGDLDFSGFTPKISDRRVTLREYLPYKKILDSPIVASVGAASNGNYNFNAVLPGRYWLEAGRRTSCSAWYPSLYPNNNLYFEGADRRAERWKTVAGKYPEYQKSYTMGYVAKSPPSGYQGWMYRGFCEQRGRGAIMSTEVTIAQVDGDSVHPPKNYTVGRGATVSGHIARIDGKSNKEMLVSIYSTQGVLVMRTAYSGKSGNFTVRGLASGNYNIELNADSWRGIGRTFRGKHTIRVTAGNSYGVGTLAAKF